MKYILLSGAIVLATLLIMACAPVQGVSGVPTEIQPLEPAIMTTVSTVVTESAIASATKAVVNTPTETGTPETRIPITDETTVKATLSNKYGLILVDDDGIALYLFTKDTQNGNSSTCSDEECTKEWTPLTTQGAPAAGEGVIQKMLGMITREDGTMQVTYNGWPLYYSTKDIGAGSTKGQGLEKSWFLVSPSGMAVRK